MGWQDAPELTGWQSAPEVSPAPPPAPKMSWTDIAKRQGLLGVRHGINAVAALPLMAMDAGIGLRNAMSGTEAKLYNPKTNAYERDPNAAPAQKENFDSATSMFDAGLDRIGLPRPETKSEKIGGVVSQMLLGTKLPVPGAADQAPAAFTKADPTKIATLKASQEAGYVVPPSTTNPTVKNKIIESLGGKIATAQDAAAKNSETTNALIKSEFGIHPDAPLTKETFKALRDDVAPAYEAIRKAGTMTADDTYTAALDKIGEKYAGASKSFPGLGNEEVGKVVESLKQPQFEADHAIDATKVLREKAGDAYAAGNKTLGKAYRSASDALENLIERNLSASGEQGAALLSKFKEARQIIAKTYSAEKALNPATGNIVATKLATQLTKGSPMTGGLLTAARFGQAFPKAAREVTDSGAVRNTDVILGAGTAAMTKEPWALAYPFSRMAARDYLLGPGQKAAVPTGPADQSQLAASLAQLLKRVGQ